MKFIAVVAFFLSSYVALAAGVDEVEQKKLATGYSMGVSPYDIVSGPRYEIGFSLNDSSDNPKERSWSELTLSHGSNVDVLAFKDFGQVSEQRLELSTFGSRPAKYEGFAWFFGVSYFLSELKVQSLYWNQPVNPKTDSIKASSFGFNIGIGNRWRFENNFFLSIDWIKWSQPAVYFSQSYDKQEFTPNAADQKSLEDANKSFLYYPRIEFLKIRAGYFF